MAQTGITGERFVTVVVKTQSTEVMLSLWVRHIATEVREHIL